MITAWKEEDIKAFEARGKDPEEARRQIELLKKGAAPAVLVRPAAVGDGIMRLNEAEAEAARQSFLDEAKAGRASFFIPASGAASRMFKALHAVKNGETPLDFKKREPAEFFSFLKQVKKLPFYEKLREVIGKPPEELIAAGDVRGFLEAILSEQGLGYQNLPKGLIVFHRYPGESRTAFEEHAHEAYAMLGGKAPASLHFTISRKHQNEIEQALKRVEATTGAKNFFKATFSEQEPSTDTPAVTPDGKVFRDGSGKVVLRPAGHGALLRNLEALGGDIVLIKNIDNISHDARRAQVIYWRSVLGGKLVEVQKKIFKFLEKLENTLSKSEEEEIERFCLEALGKTCPQGDKKKGLLKLLNRPIRVCGMVANEGQPGGGPFWTQAKDGTTSLQIVESVQVDLDDPAQREIFMRSTHFNPVDMACGLKDYRGNRFKLEEFCDPDAVIITKKSKEGRELLALELPGLWNGAMADWSTIFVEIPADVFTPVKTVYDLLKPEHSAESL